MTHRTILTHSLVRLSLGVNVNQLAPPYLPPTLNDELLGNGAAKWRSTSSLAWRKSSGSGARGVYAPSVSQSLLNGRSWTFEFSRPF